MTAWSRLFLVAALGLSPMGQAAAQQAEAGQDLARRLDRTTLDGVRSVLDRARTDSLPTWALEQKALEGVAKQIPGPRIVAAIARLADDLRATRGLLQKAGLPALPEQDLLAATEVRRGGVADRAIIDLRRASPGGPLAVPYAVLGELNRRGVPTDVAVTTLAALLANGMTGADLAELPARVDVALRVGAPPAEALASAVRGQRGAGHGSGPPPAPGSRSNRPDGPPGQQKKP